MKKKKLKKETEEKILADVDDEISLMYERIKLKYGLTWWQSRDVVNKSLKELYTKHIIHLLKNNKKAEFYSDYIRLDCFEYNEKDIKNAIIDLDRFKANFEKVLKEKD